MCGRQVKKVKQIILLFSMRQANVTKHAISKQSDLPCWLSFQNMSCCKGGDSTTEI